MSKFYLDLMAACHCNSIKVIQRYVTNHYNRTLAPVGLTATQLTFLLAIGSNPGLSMSELSSLLELDLSASLRGAEALEKKGLVKIISGGQRRRELFLEEKAVRKIDEAQVFLDIAESSLPKAIPEQSKKNLACLLEVINRKEEEIEKIAT
ncbi:MarR family transcriptional regulator [Kiloniella sp. b19]|uniref:MarR family transcriptional regulator n=1 Tax=Kiloniella sp. GXU_MW_B19 TaxID=3141326 RepID=UPI0031DB7D9E